MATLVAVVPIAMIVFVATMVSVVPVDRIALAKTVLILPQPVGEDDDPPPPTDPFFVADAQPGAPRPWERGIQVGPYSTVNVLNRNLYTVIPIVS